MQRLIIRHLSNEEGVPRFRAERASNGKTGDTVEITPPAQYPVGEAKQDLRQQLRWYLEDYLRYPFHPYTDQAKQVLAALRQWGTDAFEALFNAKRARDFYRDIVSQDPKELQLEIASDDPRILAWPWEALYDPDRQTLAHQCQIVRRLNEIPDPLDPFPNLPQDCIQILLITARPYAGDVQYGSIAKPLVELIHRENLPARVTMLRPPTMEKLQRHLEENPGKYHIVHFDGHGSFRGENAGEHVFKGPQGKLAFENEQGEEALFTAEQISVLLAEHRIPAVVLNACQSGMMETDLEDAEDAFASVSASLLRAGVRSVVAMAYRVYVTAAQEFVPEFYRKLFATGSFAAATRGGRRQLLMHKGRQTGRGMADLEDWLVPVLYEQEPLELDFAQQAILEPVEIPESIADLQNPHGLIGRDAAILQLERATRRNPAAILLTGLGGVGKTTLAHGFARWLVQTEGLQPDHVFVMRFDESLRTADYVINALGIPLFGSEFGAADLKQRIEALSQALKEHRFLIMWDNFEVVQGVTGEEDATLPPKDREALQTLLTKLRGGKSKVLITSRTDEKWLSKSDCFRVPLGGLQGEERWELCAAILDDLGLQPNRENPAFQDLMDQLAGHPLAMRAVLSRMDEQSPAQLLARLQEDGALSAGDKGAEQHLLTALKFVEEGLPEELRPLLVPLSLYDRYVDADYLEAMAKQVDESLQRSMIDSLTMALCRAGLLRDVGQSIYEMHPWLSRYLRTQKLDDAGNLWTHAFVDVMAQLADQVAPKKLHEQRYTFYVHGANFRRALALAEQLEMDQHFAALTQSLASFALNTRDFANAERLYREYAEHKKQIEDNEGEATAYHQLGRIAEEQRQLAEAQKWYLKSLAIKEKQGNQHGAAQTYHQLGSIAQEQRQLAEAQDWYLKSLAISEKQDIEHLAAKTYHQLGSIAQQQRQFAEAQNWYLKSLEIEEKHGNQHGAASTYHQLGSIAQEQRQLAEAQDWYLKSLAISEKQDIEHLAASTYHQLGIMAQKQRQFAEAQNWYLKSLEIKEKQGNQHGAAMTYHQLGSMAQQQRQFTEAQDWYLKSLEIAEKLGDQHGAALTYGQLALLAEAMQQPLEAASFFTKAACVFHRVDPHHLQMTKSHMLRVLGKMPATERAAALAQWPDAGLPEITEKDIEEASKQLEAEDVPTGNQDE